MAWAGTITYGAQERRGKYLIQHGNILMDSSYDADGEDVSAETWNTGQVIDVNIDPKASNATYKLWYDSTTDMVYASTRADGEEVADTTDLSGVTVPFEIVKKH